MHKILLCIFFWWITIFLFSAFCTIKIVGVCLGWGVNCNDFGNSSALFCCFLYWWGIDKPGRVRYRYGFPAAEEIKHRGRDTGQTRWAYSSFFSA